MQVELEGQWIRFGKLSSSLFILAHLPQSAQTEKLCIGGSPREKRKRQANFAKDFLCPMKVCTPVTTSNMLEGYS